MFLRLENIQISYQLHQIVSCLLLLIWMSGPYILIWYRD